MGIKEFDKILVFLNILVIVFFIGSNYMTYYATTKASFQIEETKCYDRFSNEIEGLSCEEKIYDSIFMELFSAGILNVFSTILFVLMMFLDFITILK